MKKLENLGKRFGLARVLSKMGLASRTQAAQMIANGLVQVNRKTIYDAEFPVRMEIDQVTLNHIIAEHQQRVVVMLNKPRGLVTTRNDEHQRATVYDCVPVDMPWLAPVGRLDKASEGLLLMSNDPEWAATITDPQYRVVKTYHVQVSGKVTAELLQQLTDGAHDVNDFLSAQSVRILREGDKNTWLEFKLSEGKNRHIRRLLEHFDIKVLRLIRVAIGGLTLGDLPKGQFRELDQQEIALLNNA
ncbi:MAG TPA: pseudouridine synthase [Arenimonas sp.]|nr:pseudouridine synthase [Arenimonas sp.]